MRMVVKDALFFLLLAWLLPTAVRGQSVGSDPIDVESASPVTHASSAPNPVPRTTPAKSSLSSAPHSSVHDADGQVPRLLDNNEGLRVIAAAMDAHIRHASGDDCSRLVHEIYERAGFPYPYATSRELYGGAGQFRRVWTPQPGDLIVWRGHVGIVVSPRDHLFFSKLTSSGQDVASYDNRYWQRRGRAHFLRYVKDEPGMEVAVSRETELAESASAPAYYNSLAAVDAVMPAGDSEPESASPSPHLESDAEVRMLQSRHPKPDDVRRAVMQQIIERGATAGRLWAATSPTPLIVFDTLRVDHVRLDGNEGEAEVRIHQIGSVTGGRADSNKRTQRAFWSLRRRDPETWEIEAPPDAVYLTRAAAVPVIAHCLAALTDRSTSSGADDKSQGQSLVHLLGLLMVP